MEKFIHTPQTPAKSWDDLESTKHQEILKKAPRMKKNSLILVAALASVLAFSSCGGDKSEKDKIYDAYNNIENSYKDAKKNTVSEKEDVEEAKIKLQEEERESSNAVNYERELKVLLSKANDARKRSDLEKIESLSNEIEILKEKYDQ